MPTDDLYILTCIMGTLLIIVSFSYIGHEIFKLIKKFINGKKIVFDIHISPRELTKKDFISREFVVFQTIPVRHLKFFKKLFESHLGVHPPGTHYAIIFREVDY